MNHMESPSVPPVEGNPPQRRAVPWGSGDISWAIVIVVSAFPLLVLLGRAIISATDITVSAATVLISIAIQLLLAVITVLFTVRKYGVAWRDLGFRDFAQGKSLFYAGAAVVASVMVVSLYGAVINYFGLQDRIPPMPIFKEQDRVLLTTGIIAATVLAPVVEETFFRGFVFAGLRKTIGPSFAGIMSAALFAVAHMSLFLYPPVFLIGLLLAWVFHKTGSLWYGIAAHLAYNSLVAYIALTQR